MTRFLTALILSLLAATGGLAQVFPSENGTPIIDDAGLLPDADEARLVTELNRVKADTGAEVWVVTLLNTALYAGGEDVAAYADLLFGELGLAEVLGGKAALLLVFQEDRELRIKVGQAYDAAEAQAIVDELILPAFAVANYAMGIEAGVQGMIGQLVSPVPVVAAAEEAAPVAAETPAAGGGNALYWVLGAIAAAIGGIVALVKRSAARLAAMPCPACGKTGLTRAAVVLAEATEKAEGRGETRTSCPHCAHVTAVPYVIAKQERTDTAKAAPKTKDAPKGGGGASGNW